MVYCKLLSKDTNMVSYAIGALWNDLTGVIKIDSDGRGFEIVKQPKKEAVYPHFINKMLVKYLELFEKGEIPEKMSYEI